MNVKKTKTLNQICALERKCSPQDPLASTLMRSRHYVLKPGLTVSARSPVDDYLCNELVRGCLGSPRQLMTQLRGWNMEDNKPEYENRHAQSRYFTSAPPSGLLILGRNNSRQT